MGKKKKNTVEALLVVGGITIPATLKVDVSLDLTDAGLMDVVMASADPAEVPTDEDWAEDPHAEEPHDTPEQGTGPGNQPPPAADRVRVAIQNIRGLSQGDIPPGVLGQFPLGYSLSDADRARGRILDMVERNLNEVNINAFANDANAFLHRMGSTSGGDKVVAEFIHSRLAEAARS